MTVSVHVDPFPGLRSFEPDEDHLFFGRERHVDELLGRLRRTRFLAVVGGSGSGKSSLVKSGLIPSLRGGYMVQAGSSWRVALLRPGADPIQNLASALNDPHVLGVSPSMDDLTGALLDSSLRRSSQGLIDAVRQRRLPPGDELLVIVDQFEELFRFKPARAMAGRRDEAVAFVQLLLEAARQDEVPIYIVLTMRSEFIGSCPEFPGLPEAINDGQYLVPRMTRDQLRLAITGPIAVGGGTIAPRLVTRLLNEVGDDPDQLPVLQHALMRTWDHWRAHRAGQQPIDFVDYEAIGTMSAALSRHADEAYEEIVTDRRQHCAELVFKALTETTEQGLGLRRPCRVQEFCDIAGATLEEIAAVIDGFRIAGRSFLVPSIETPLLPQTIVDLSHESLMRLWSRLVGWTQEEARSAEIYRRLSAAALLHARGEAGLWRDPELQLTVNWRGVEQPTAAWARRYDAAFERATEFLERSIEARDAETVRRQAEAAARLQQEQAIRRRTKAIFALSIVSGIVVLVLTIAAYRSRRAADDLKAKAEALNVQAIAAAQHAKDVSAAADDDKTRASTALRKAREDADAQLEAAGAKTTAAEAVADRERGSASAALLAIGISEDLHDDPTSIETAGLLAIEALKLDRSTPVARHILMDVLQLLPPAPVIPRPQGHRGAVRAMAVDPGGRWLVTYGEDRRLVLWDFSTRQVRRTIANDVEAVQDLTISADGRLVLAATASDIDVWDTGTDKLIQRLSVPRGRDLALSPDGSLLAVTTLSGGYKLFRTADWEEVPRAGDSVGIRKALFSPDGIHILETQSGIRLASAANDAPGTTGCRASQFGADGNLIAKCRDGFAEFTVTHDALERTDKALVITAPLQEWRVNRPDDRRPSRQLVVTWSSSALTVFERGDRSDRSSAVEYLRFPRSFSFRQVVVPARGEWFASADNAGTVMFWRLSHGMAQPLPYKARIKDLTFSHDERLVAAVEAAGRINVFATNNATAKASMQLPASTGLRNPKFSPDDSLFAVLDESVLRVIRTSKWQLMPERTIKATTDGHEMSFFFTGSNGDLVVAEPGLVRRFRLTPWTQLPSLAPSRTAKTYVSADRRWMAFLEPDQKTGGMSRFFDADSGQRVAPAQIPQLRGIDAERLTPSAVADILDGSAWVSLPDRQNRLSGEGDGGEWWTLDASDIGITADLEISERRTGHTVARLVHDDVVHSVAISSQGNWIATASGDRDIFLWPWSQEGLIKLTCARLPRNLTRQEWKSKNLEAIGFGPYQRTCPNLPWPAGDSAKADVR